jgi:tRNA-binding EMAP/Myf-like protein
MRGFVSEGMLLAADNPDGSANVIFVADDIAPGSKVR